MTGLHLLDWIFITLYFAGMGYLGYYFSKKNKDTEEYFVGGRKFKGWVIGISLVGTSISSISVVIEEKYMDRAQLALEDVFEIP